MSTLNIQSLCRKSKIIAICFLNWCHDFPQWLELPMPRTNFHGPKDVRAIEVRLYMSFTVMFHRGARGPICGLNIYL